MSVSHTEIKGIWSNHSVAMQKYSCTCNNQIGNKMNDIFLKENFHISPAFVPKAQIEKQSPFFLVTISIWH